MSQETITDLLDPKKFHEPIDVEQKNNDLLIEGLEMMLTIRHVETKLAFGREHGFIRGPVHLGVGQEAIAVGVSQSLLKSDFVFGAHRSHSHVLALGSDLQKLFAEVLGRSTGLSRGMGGSMHLWDEPNGFYGSVPIVAGTVPIAVGAAMATRLQGLSNVSVAYLGDGACEEGIVHEALNLASLNKEPILFVIENNLFASHMHWSQRQVKASTARFGLANDMETRVVDGNDLMAVSNAAKRLISSARSGKGPGFLEAFTYRWYGHVDWRQDIDVGVARSKSEVTEWRKRDPIKRLVSGLIKCGKYSNEKFEDLQYSVASKVDHAWEQALSAPVPDVSEIMDNVYENE